MFAHSLKRSAGSFQFRENIRDDTDTHINGLERLPPIRGRFALIFWKKGIIDKFARPNAGSSLRLNTAVTCRMRKIRRE